MAFSWSFADLRREVKNRCHRHAHSQLRLNEAALCLLVWCSRRDEQRTELVGAARFSAGGGGSVGQV